MEVTTIGLDIAKNVFQLAAQRNVMSLIGPKRRILRCNRMSAVGGIATFPTSGADANAE